MYNSNTPNIDTKRNISLDLLKIVAMWMVVLVHLSNQGIKESKIMPLSSLDWICKLINSFSLVAVNCFVLISGYFLSVKEVHHRKLISLWIQVATYSVGIYLVLCLIPSSGIVFSAKTLLRQCLPLMSQQYWFFTFYFLLYLLAPYLNKLINALSQKEYRYLLLSLFLIFSFIPSVNPFGDSFKVNSGYSLTWFLVLYFIAGYIRRWPPANNKIWIWLYLLLCLVLGVFRTLVPVIGDRIPFYTALINKETTYNAPIIFFASLSLFLWAVMNPLHASGKVGPFLSKITSLTFGVYLLHDNGLINPILWNRIVRMQAAIHSCPAFLFRLLIASLTIFICGIIVEWIRKTVMNIISKLFMTRFRLVW